MKLSEQKLAQAHSEFMQHLNMHCVHCNVGSEANEFEEEVDMVLVGPLEASHPWETFMN